MGIENVMTNNLSKLCDFKKEEFPLDDCFLDDRLITLVQSKVLWYVDFINYLTTGVLPPDMDYQHKKNFSHDLKQY